MVEEKKLYDTTILAERLEDLRMRDGYNKITLKELSEKITEKTGEYISTNTLGKYQKEEEAEKMGVRNLITIANFYEVSLDYLFGKTNSKRNNYTDRMTAKKFSLTDRAMAKLENLTYHNLSHENDYKLNLINYIIENDWFINELAQKTYKYYKAIERKERNYPNAEEEEFLARYDLMKIFEKFGNESKEKLYNPPKSKPLFEMEKNKKRKGGTI